MLAATFSSLYRSSRASVLVTALLAILAHAQNAPPIHVGGVEVTGVPEDWSHHYVVFSNPGTEQEAIANGRHEQWQRVVNEPRYVIQQLRRNAPVHGPAAVDVEYRARWIAEAAYRHDPVGTPEELGPPEVSGGPLQPILVSEQIKPPSMRRDWSQSLGGSGLRPGHYPAKYSISITSASCSDYVVFPTGAAGSATQATIVAFRNIYVGTGGCAASNPTVYWAYNTGTGATANLSPVLSLDGSQVVFTQVSSSVASLVVLKMASSGGSVTAPAAITSVTAANYRTCTAPCYTAIAFNGSPNDTNSAPFYLYDGSDTLYVGGDSGRLHQFTGVFSGTPSETTANGWPATVSTKASPGLASPIYDSGGSTLVYVGDASGYLNSVTTTGTTRTVATSNQLICGTAGFVGPPNIDSTTEQVYAFIGDGCDATPGNSYVNRFAAGTTVSGRSFGQNFANYGNASTNNTATVNRVGAFDNLYFTGSGNTGNIYACVNGRVYQIPMASLSPNNSSGFTLSGPFSTLVGTVSSASTCSTMTEFPGSKANTTLTATLGTTGNPSVASTTGMAVNDYLQIDSEIMKITQVTPTFTVTRGQLGTTAASHTSGAAVQDVQDWIFTSVVANGNVASCSGACVYNFLVTTGATTGTPTAGLAATGGSSSIIIDNLSTTQVGAQQVYFTTLGGNTAVQASQSGLK